MRFILFQKSGDTDFWNPLSPAGSWHQ